MPSPFPGMDPYIESDGKWGDFHLNMLSAMRGQLNPRLPRGYVAETDQYVWVQKPDEADRPRLRKPDVYVTGRGRGNGAVALAPVIDDPMTLALPRSEYTKHRYLRIVDQSTRRVITVIELLSPSNKEGGDKHEAYLLKRREYFGGQVNLVEIDLLRGGPRLPLGSRRPRSFAYYVAIFRSWQYPRFGFWPFGLRDPLPEVPVPLLNDVRPVMLSLRPCADRVYDEGRYGENLRYDKPPKPELPKKDAGWVRQILSAHVPEN